MKGMGSGGGNEERREEWRTMLPFVSHATHPKEVHTCKGPPAPRKTREARRGEGRGGGREVRRENGKGVPERRDNGKRGGSTGGEEARRENGK